MGTSENSAHPLEGPQKKGPICGKNLVGTTDLVCQNVLPPRNVPGRQRDQMPLGPENYLGGHATQKKRHCVVLMPEISDDRSIVAYQDDTDPTAGAETQPELETLPVSRAH